MKKVSVISFAVFFMMACQAIGDGQWADIEVIPQNPTTSDVVAITLSGQWGDSCVPNGSAILVAGTDIYFDVILDYPPGTVCAQVITGWELIEYVGPLSEGTYTVYTGLTDDPCLPPETYTYMTDFIVTDYQFVLSAEPLTVPEGQTATFTVALLMEPNETVVVSVARQSGDPDITVESGASLTFDPCNYSIPQTVTIAAAEDEDCLNGKAIIWVSATGYLTAEVTATELDNDTSPVLHVDVDAPAGVKSGANWEQAFTDLQEALSVVAVVPEVEEIRVAQGVYTPAGPSGDRNATVQLINGVAIKGGYAGFGELYPDARNVQRCKTILNGDLNGDDVGDLNDPSRNENSYHVVTGDSVNKTAVLDGFTITAGNGENGAGIYISGGLGPMIRSCIISGNRANNWGGGIYSRASSAIISCIFSGNSANKGGGMYSYAGSPTLTNCTLNGNLADDSGGGLYVRGNGGDPKLTNCIFWGNGDSGGTGESAQTHINYTYESTTIINYCCIQGWTGSLIGTNNIGDDPLFVDADNGDYHLQSQAGRWDPNSESWVIDANTSDCIDAGNPGCPVGSEPMPNGNRINMGAYGDTPTASKSPADWRSIADLTNNWVVDFNDLAVFVNYWLDAGECVPSDLNRSESVDFADYAIFADNWRVE